MMRNFHLFFARLLRAALCFGALVWSVNALAFDPVNRWSATQIDGGGLQRGDPVNLRWSVVPDGQSYSRSNNSQLIQFLDDGWNVPAVQRTPDFTNRAWWTVMNNAYAQFGRVAGMTLTYVPEQNASGIDTGLEGDIRVGGENLDGTPGGALADNTFPNDGDMRIDTTRESNGTIGFYFSTEAGFRNLIIHESGHGVGLGHVDFVNGSGKAVMEGGLRTDIWGFQFDDAYGLNRLYGDPREKNGGNNSPTTASILGNFGTTGSVSWGTDGTDHTIEQFDDDFLSVDGSDDFDWFRFSISGESFAGIKVTPIGPSYETVNNGVVNASSMSDLSFQLYRASTSISVITNVSQAGLGAAEILAPRLLTVAGDYLIRVRADQDFNQFYQLDLTLSDAPLAGTSADLDLDGMTNFTDWSIFLANAYTDLTSYTRLDAFRRGDLDGDGDSDYRDFRFFGDAFDAINGAGAFASLTQVPEPGSLMLVGIVLVGFFFKRRQ